MSQLGSRKGRGRKYTVNHWLRMAGVIVDASLAFEFHAFTGKELKEGIAGFQEGRKPVFSITSAFTATA